MAQNRTDTPTPAKQPKIDTTAASTLSQDQADDDIQLVRIFCMNLRPSYILQDGLQEFIKKISHFNLPSIDKFSGELIPQEYNRARSGLMKTLESVHYVAISIETWK